MLIVILALLGLLLALMMYCCCVVAGRADRAAEAYPEHWHSDHTGAEE